jgi:hypothetical protein
MPRSILRNHADNNPNDNPNFIPQLPISESEYDSESSEEINIQRI